MSIVGLRKIFGKSVGIRIGKRKLRLGSLMVIVLVGLSALFILALIPGGPSVGTQQGPADQDVRQVTPLMAKVNGHRIERRDFELRLLRMLDEARGMPLSDQAFAKYQLLDSIMEHHLLLKATSAEGVKASRKDVNARIEELVKSSIDRRFPDQRELRKYLKRQELSYEQYAQQLRDRFAADREGLRGGLLMERLQAKIQEQVKVTEETVKKDYEEVKARHILIRPDKLAQDTTSEDYSSEGSEADSSAAELSPEQAQEQAWHKTEELLAKIEEGADFAQLAQEYSHDSASATEGGDLGWFSRRGMVKEFSDAAFALEPGQVSGVVTSAFGLHIIKVEDKRINLPEDFEEQKQRYIDQQKATQEWQAWSEYRQNLKQQAKIEIYDPELHAMDMLRQGRQAEAIPLLEEAVQYDSYNMAARYTLATIHQQEGRKDQAIEYFRQIAERAGGASSPEVHMVLGKLLREQKRNDEALQEFKSASDWAAALQYGNNRIHTELRGIYKEMGHTEGVQQEQKWLEEFQELQEESLGSSVPLPLN